MTSLTQASDRSIKPLVRRAAVSALFVVGLGACGGAAAIEVAAPVEEPVVVDEVESAPVTITETDFIAASAAETSTDVVSEALALVAADSPPSPSHAQGVHAVLSDGQFFLRGSVPSAEIAESVVIAAEQVFGPGNVINEYSIDPEVNFNAAGSQSIFLADSVVFGTNSAEIGEDFVEVLSFVPVLLSVQPDVTIWAFGHTDDVGDAEANVRLSQARVDAARDFVIDLGGDPERIFANGQGEANPIADNATEEGRAANRRVEFVIQGFDIDQ